MDIKLKITVTFQTEKKKKGVGEKATTVSFCAGYRGKTKIYLPCWQNTRQAREDRKDKGLHLCPAFLTLVCVQGLVQHIEKNVCSWDREVREVRNGMYQSVTLVPKQENVSRKYFTNKKFQNEQWVHKENSAPLPPRLEKTSVHSSVRE